LLLQILHCALKSKGVVQDDKLLDKRAGGVRYKSKLFGAN